MKEKVIKKKKELPYLFKLNKGNQSLFYFGTEHSVDPDHHQFKILKSSFNDFLKNTNENKIVFIEGNEILSNVLLNNEEDNIRRFGERGLLLNLVLKNNIEYVYAELSFQEEADLLNKEFSKEHIVYFYITRLISGLLRKNPDMNFDQALSFAVDDWSHHLNWEKEFFTVDKIKQIHKDLFQSELSSESVELIKKVCIPVNEEFSVINKIAKASSQTRDDVVLEKVKKAWRKGKNIFIVYGYNHSDRQEPVLREVCK